MKNYHNIERIPGKGLRGHGDGTWAIHRFGKPGTNRAWRAWCVSTRVGPTRQFTARTLQQISDILHTLSERTKS